MMKKMNNKELLIEKLQDELRKDIFLIDDEDEIDFQEDMNSYLDSIDDYDDIDAMINWYLFY